MNKNILYCIGDLVTPGGIGRIVSLKANWFAQHGYNVTIIMTEGDGTLPIFYELDRRIKIVFLNLNFCAVYENSTGLIGMLKSYLDRRKKNRRFKEKIQEYLTDNPTDVFFSTDNNKAITQMKDGSKKIFEFHFSPQSQVEFSKCLPWYTRWLYVCYDKIQRRNYKHYDAVVCLTERGRQHFGNPNNFHVIPNFISLENPHPVSNGISKKAISVGRLSTAKGFDFLIRAWKNVYEQHPDWTLDIYGYSYGREKEFENIILECGLKNIVYIHPAVKDIAEKYAEASFYVMSSRNEGFPLVLPEAMDCGLPVVSYDCNSGPSEIITSGVDGILVSPVGDIQALSFAICQMIADNEMRETMRKNALKNVKRYSQDVIMTQWVNLIDSL